MEQKQIKTGLVALLAAGGIFVMTGCLGPHGSSYGGTPGGLNVQGNFGPKLQSGNCQQRQNYNLSVQGKHGVTLWDPGPGGSFSRLSQGYVVETINPTSDPYFSGCGGDTRLTYYPPVNRGFNPGHRGY